MLLVPLQGILKTLEGERHDFLNQVEHAQKGAIVDAKLYTFAYALEAFQ